MALSVLLSVYDTVSHHGSLGSMARWEPDAEERLRRAAVALFVDRGYDSVTVSDIADHAGLKRRSFFRYFPDKREVLFAGSNRLSDGIEQRLDEAAPTEPIKIALVRVLAEVGAVLIDDRASQQQRQMIIASNLELQERERTKTAHISTAIAHALTRKGVHIAEAGLLGAVYAEVFRFAYGQALADTQMNGFATHLWQAVVVIETSFRPLPNGQEDIARRTE